MGNQLAHDFTLAQTAALIPGTRPHQVALARLDGKTPQETAEELRCTVIAVQAALKKARRLMELGDGREAAAHQPRKPSPKAWATIDRAGLAEEFPPEKLEMLAGKTLEAITRLLAGENDEQVAVAMGTAVVSVATKVAHARSMIAMGKPMRGSVAFVREVRLEREDEDEELTADLPRCACGLLLSVPRNWHPPIAFPTTCDCCVGDVTDYLGGDRNADARVSTGRRTR